MELLSAELTIEADSVPGAAAGKFGHSLGLEAVPGVAGSIIVPEFYVLENFYGSAPYGGGGNLWLGFFSLGGGNIMKPLAAGYSFGASGSTANRVGAADVMGLLTASGASAVGESLRFRTATPFTTPAPPLVGGSAKLTVSYRLIALSA